MSKELQNGLTEYAKEAQEIRDKLKAYIDKWSWIVTDFGWEFEATYCSYGARTMIFWSTLWFTN